MAERKLSEYVSVIATIDPDEYTTASYQSDVWDMQNFTQVMAVIMGGSFGTAGTLDAKFQFAPTSNGTYTTVPGIAITQLTEAATSSDRQAVMNVSAGEVGASTNRWGRVNLDVGVETTDCAVIVLGKPVRTEAFTTIAAHDLSTVSEIV